MRLRGGMLYDEGKFSRADLTVGVSASSEEYDIKDLIILPGLADVHVHLREPGFLIKKLFYPERKVQRKEVLRRYARCPT